MKNRKMLFFSSKSHNLITDIFVVKFRATECYVHFVERNG